MGFNLFGDLAAALTLADRAVHEWWPDVPGTVSEVRFAHSPGRLDPAWLGNLFALDVALVLDITHGASASRSQISIGAAELAAVVSCAMRSSRYETSATQANRMVVATSSTFAQAA